MMKFQDEGVDGNVKASPSVQKNKIDTFRAAAGIGRARQGRG